VQLPRAHTGAPRSLAAWLQLGRNHVPFCKRTENNLKME